MTRSHCQLQDMARSFGERFGARLRAGRRALGLSQEDLAQAADLSANYIGLIERGVRQPTLDALVRLARAIDQKPGRLMGDAEPGDDWLDDILAVARTVPKPLRQVALAVLRAVAEGTRAQR